jgi:hypothetical protein
MNIYKNSVGITFEVSTEYDLTSTTNTALLVKKPSNKTATWPAIVYGDPTNGVLSYTSVSGDLNEDGFYFLQAYTEFPTGKVLYGVASRFKVMDSYEVP